MAINFPSTSSSGVTHTHNGKTWVYDGIGWISQSNTSSSNVNRSEVDTSNIIVLDPNDNYSQVSNPDKLLASEGIHVGYIEGFKSYSLLKFHSNLSDLWVTVYTDLESMKNDINRLFTQDPVPGSGVIAEFVSSSDNQSLIMTPTTNGFNMDELVNNNLYLKIQNKSTTQLNTEYQITLTLVQLET